jgi:hypothetical protein
MIGQNRRKSIEMDRWWVVVYIILVDWGVSNYVET